MLGRLLRLVVRAAPAPIADRARASASLRAADRWRYWRTLVTTPSLWSRRVPPSLPPRPTVLFVCHGNIMRSAIAEALFRREVGDAVRVISAGTFAVDGRPADPRMVAAARDLAISLDAHRARLVRREDVHAASLVLSLDGQVEAHLLCRFPEFAAKLRLLGAFDADRGQTWVIEDPFSGSDAAVAASAERVALATKALARQLQAGPA